MYLFRDVDNNPNLSNGKSFHAAGYVKLINSQFDDPAASGKDMVVCFLDPFEARVITEWRAFSEVELFEVDVYEQLALIDKYDLIINALR